jgi:flagellin-like protein
MKGISPMIAIVLLIAFTVALGGVLSVWLTGLTTTQTQQVTNQSSSQVKCSPSLSVDSVLTKTQAGWTNVSITYSNPSQQSISNIAVLIPVNLAGANTTVYSPASQIITAGGVGTAYANITATPTFIRVSGLCSGLPVSATCDNSMVCWTTS